jgi:hypothetical protein
MTNFIQSAVKHPGAATAAAKAEGLSVHDWAVKHQHDKNVTGQRARLALTLERMHGGASKPSLADAAQSK